MNNMDEKIDIEERIVIAKGIVSELKNANEDVEYNGGVGGTIRYAGANLNWRISEHGDLVVAGLLNSDATKSGADYLYDAKAYTQDLIDREKIIKLSRKAIAEEGIVASAIEALIEVPTLGGWYIDEDNEELRTLCEYWLENIDAIGYNDKKYQTIKTIGGIESLVLNILFGLYENGDEVIGEVWENVKVPKLNDAKRNLPIRFISYDVVNLNIDKRLASIGKEVISLKIDSDISRIVKDGPDNDDEQIILDNLPQYFIDAVRKEDVEYYKLDPTFITHFSRRNNRRSAWGMPYVYRAFSALAYKYRLRALDNATIDGLIQRVWIIKIGSTDVQSPYHIVTQDRIALALAALKQIKVNNVLIWGGADIATEEFNSSDSSVLSFSDRYKSADDDIQKALGVPRFLIDGSGLSGGNSDWLLLAKTISQMERYQIMIERWINMKLREIAVENGYKNSFPVFHWTFLKLRNQDKTKNLVTELYKSNLIGVRRALHMLGLPAEEIVNEMIKEKDEGLREKLPINILPYDFKNQPGRPAGTPDGGGTDKRKNKTSNPDSNRNGK